MTGSPGFTAAAIATMALGIGINATGFTISNAVLFKNQPFADSGRILYVNPAINDMFGYQQTEMVSRSIATIQPERKGLPGFPAAHRRCRAAAHSGRAPGSGAAGGG